VSRTLHDIYLIDSENGVVVGDSGTILKTTNAGISWESQLSSTTNSLTSVFFTDINNGTVVGQYGIIKRTTDSGQNWFSQISPSTTGLSDVFFTDYNNGIIVGGAGTILKTTDSGQNWYTRTSPTGYTLYDVIFTDSKNGFAVGGFRWEFPVSVIIKTTDGGDSWSTRLYANNSCLLNISFFDANNGIASGDNGVMYSTSNGGTNWIQLPRVTYNDIYASSGIDANSITIVGEYGVILNKKDLTIPIELTSFTAFISFNCINLNWSTATELNNYGFEIERSSDKTDWRTIGFRNGKGTTTEPQNYSFIDDLFGVNSQKLYYRLKQIDFNGTFEYSDIVEVDIAPLSFALHQNYPNPFNPSTKISWQSPVSSWQTIKVYDVLGREVATLFDEYRNAGYHEVDFNSAGLASGIYYYHLKSGDFIETKKMILVR
jgi:photosystem II stability/assembly factor-like uncharacterized protein